MRCINIFTTALPTFIGVGYNNNFLRVMFLHLMNTQSKKGLHILFHFLN